METVKREKSVWNHAVTVEENERGDENDSVE
jgi:hypothetical protein